MAAALSKHFVFCTSYAYIQRLVIESINSVKIMSVSISFLHSTQTHIYKPINSKIILENNLNRPTDNTFFMMLKKLLFVFKDF